MRKSGDVFNGINPLWENAADNWEFRQKSRIGLHKKSNFSELSRIANLHSDSVALFFPSKTAVSNLAFLPQKTRITGLGQNKN